MGYSVTFPVRNRKLGDKMVAFLRENGRSLSALAGLKKEPQELYGPYWADGKGDKASRSYGGLSYCHRKNHIGFDYGQHREYKFTLVKWMALKIGARSKGVPRYLYDGHEWIDIDPNEHDETGMPKDLQNSGLFMTMAHPKFRPILTINGHDPIDLIAAEMKRLNDMWEAEARCVARAALRDPETGTLKKKRLSRPRRRK